MKVPFRFFVGVDWGSQEHTCCILDSNREQIEVRKWPHSGAGIAELADRLTELCSGDASAIAIGIETPHGAVVETMLERGFAVYSLNPKQMDRFRDRHSVSGAKDDRRDAYVIADALGTDLHKYHRVQLSSAMILRLRELCRSQENLQQQQVQVANQLRELLYRYFPQIIPLSPGMDDPWFWDLLEKAPLPVLAARLTPAKIQKLLTSHRIRRVTGKQIHELLQAPPLWLAPGSAEAASEHVLMLIPQLRLSRQLRKEVEQRIESLLQQLASDVESTEHRDVPLLLSLPGIGRVVAATMLAEAWQALAERDYHALRTYGGAAPVTKRSCKRKSIQMRQACNERLRNAFYHWSRVSIQHDPRSRSHYAEMRARGHTHGRALRGLTDRLLAVLIAILESGIAYDPAIRNRAAYLTGDGVILPIAGAEDRAPQGCDPSAGSSADWTGAVAAVPASSVRRKAKNPRGLGGRSPDTFPHHAP